MPFYFFYDPTMIFILIGLVISGIASTYVRSTYSKYADTRNNRGFTAWEVSRSILDNSGLRNVVLDRVPGNLTDHYDSQNNILRLSDATYNSTSVAAIGVAAHEAGHAIQDQENYFPLRLRSTLVPVANFGQGISFPLIIAGVIFGGNQSLINLGILFFSLTLVFQLVTLPVEFDASNRAIAILDQQQLLTPEELDQARHVLRAAALTYVAAAVASFLQVLRLVLLFGGGRRND
ncbi:hypothetical protein SAMN04488506_1443 [Desemzia incerta]|uniref:Peptidase n=1 Tax=Desemzia incerta TaxID=82801 RepID=A0A1I5XK04_9LACT|nr:zinc metallopeptidase [Desemzia incerta]SFQ32323.1 hypothetical protein SAMN04488506_1443 [Desemzia incerta]